MKRILVIVALVNFLLGANKSAFFNYDNKNGLMNTQIVKIGQSADGRMFFYSADLLTNYDGIDFKTVMIRNFENGSGVLQLKTMPDGRTMGRYFTEKYFIMDTSTDVKMDTLLKANKHYYAHAFINDSLLWFGSDNFIYRGKYDYGKDSIAVINKIPVPGKAEQLLDITFIPAVDRHLCLDVKTGLYWLDKNGKIDIVAMNDIGMTPEYVAIAHDGKNGLVLYNNNRVRVIDLFTGNTLSDLELPGNGLYLNIIYQQNGQFWVNSYNQGIFKLRISQMGKLLEMRQYKRENGLADDIVYDVFTDNNDILWVATNSGISKLPFENNEHISLYGEEGIIGSPTNFIPYKNKLYVFTAPHGIARMIDTDSGTDIAPVATNGPYSFAIYEYYISSDNRLWLFTDEGVYYQTTPFSRTPLIKYTPAASLDNLFDAAEVKRDEILICGFGSVYHLRFLNGRMTWKTVLKSKNERLLFSVVKKSIRANHFVIGADNLLAEYVLQDTLVKAKDWSQRIKTNYYSVYAYEQLGDSVMLFATNNAGLVIIDNDSVFQHINNRHIQAHTLYDIAIDGKNTIWTGSYNGLSHLEYLGQGRLKSSSKSFWNLMPPLSVNYKSIYPDDRDRIFYGLTNHIGIYYPNRDIMEIPQRDIRIAKLRLGEKKITFADLLDVPHDFSNLVIHFYYPVYLKNKRFIYQYSIAPDFQGWKTTLSPGKILISTLPHGDYDLKLRVMDHSNFEVLAEKKIALNIANPFWLTPKFYIIVLSAFMVFVVLIWNLREKYYLRNQKTLQQEIDERLEELKAVNSSLVEKNEQLGRLQKTKDEFLSIAAHDLKNPINAIANMAQLLQADKVVLRDKLNTDARLIESAAIHMLHLVNNFLSYNKIEDGSFRVYKIDVRIVELLEDVIRSFQLIARNKDLFIQFDCRADAETVVHVDPDALRQIVGNLLANSIQYSERNSKIIVHCLAKDSNIIIKVCDNGPVIPKNIRKKIFNRHFFYRHEGNNDKHRSGLGLAIVTEMANQHNGIAELLSSDDKGNVFQVTLPVIKS
jgi:signal transduction histidine kinase